MRTVFVSAPTIAHWHAHTCSLFEWSNKLPRAYYVSQSTSNIFDIVLAFDYDHPMYASNELSQAVRTRRQEIGLSQKALAELSGLSRATVVGVEQGTIKDLSLTRTGALLEALGLGLTISAAHPRLNQKSVRSTPLQSASRTASVSYARHVTPAALSNALSKGTVRAEFAPHVSTLLEEAPISLLAKAVEQVHAKRKIPREQIWKNMRQLATEFKSTRVFWNAAG